MIANEAEAMAISGADSWESAFKAIRKDLPNVIVTGGPRGALVCFEKQTVHVPAFKCKVVDTTGAGDAFAGGFLYGVTHGVSVEDSTRGACYLASKVIEQLGARLAGGVKEAWAQGLDMKS